MSARARIDDKAGGRNAQSAPLRLPRRRAAVLLGVVLGVALGLTACHKKEKAEAAGDRPTPSGLPVPRYVSLNFATVNARGGPGDDYKLLWVYRTKHLPVQVIAETPDWRKLCDPQGGVAWVHKRTLQSRRTVIRMSDASLPMRKRPTEEAPLAATLVPRGVAELGKCAEGWCQVSADRATGWVKASDVWGVADGAQCGELRGEQPRS